MQFIDGKHSSRRTMLKGVAAAAVGGVALSTAAAQEMPPMSDHKMEGHGMIGDHKMEGEHGMMHNCQCECCHPKKPAIVASSTEPVVETASGKLRGSIHKGIYSFKGIPYGADTGGANRFLPPQPLAPWAGVRSSLTWGWVSPQPARTGWKNDEEAWLFRWNDGIQSEDCLRLNLWTPATDSTKKRPVMVWLHGGGFTAGSGNEHPAYDGERLARRGDVVVVSVNHRLNIFGFLDLSSLGSRYADSGNAGMLDVVAALQWVKENIARFGGDPECVTIFGQSGGGGKVSDLMAMPQAKGLFHRAIVQSGSLFSHTRRETSLAVTQKVVEVLGLSMMGLPEQLQQISMEKLVEAGPAALERMHTPRNFLDIKHLADAASWAPVAGSPSLPRRPFIPAAPEESATVPLLVGTTLNEFVTATNQPAAFAMTEPELLTKLESVYPGRGQQIAAEVKGLYPAANPFQIFSIAATAQIRSTALSQARLKVAQAKAPVYCYQFDWQTPILDGRPMAFHCAEIAFAFDNTSIAENMTGDGPEARALAEKVCDAWLNFARSGNPNHKGLPEWKSFSADSTGTMYFDTETKFRENFDAQLQKLIS